MWQRARWWWQRRGSCWTSSWGRTSSTSLASPACTSWRSDIYTTEAGLGTSSHPGVSFPFWRGLRASEGLALYKEVVDLFLNNSRIPMHPWLSSKFGLKIPKCQNIRIANDHHRFSSKIQQLKESGPFLCHNDAITKVLIYNCVTQLKLYTLDKLSSSIFCCLSVSEM